mmetsp:Transcript_4260/g.9580  ORF Transcript_4260/g.9580 Transcript_4260/m.9580 type:complete len:94 (-) Transcript_4260:448-729(-)
MFANAVSFDQDIDEWDVSNVLTTDCMFWGAYSFNRPLNKWGEKVGNVRDASYMFQDAPSFNQPLDDWKLRNLVDMVRACVFLLLFGMAKCPLL